MKKEEEAVTQMFSNYLLCHTFFQPMIEIFHCSHKLDNCVKQNITKLMQVKMPRNNQLEDLDNTTQKSFHKEMIVISYQRVIQLLR